jgi:hypothetical protein
MCGEPAAVDKVHRRHAFPWFVLEFRSLQDGRAATDDANVDLAFPTFRRTALPTAGEGFEPLEQPLGVGRAHGSKRRLRQNLSVCRERNDQGDYQSARFHRRTLPLLHARECVSEGPKV